MPLASSLPWKRIAHAAGAAIAALSIAYVLYQAFDERIWEVSFEVLARLAGATLVGIVVYVLASLLLVLAWHEQLAWSGERPSSCTLSLAVYGRAQIAKYIPGNVFSLVGRQVLGRQAGLSQVSLAWASVLEIIGMLYASGLVACLGAGAWIGNELDMSAWQFSLLVGCIALGPLLALRLIARCAPLRRFVPANRTLPDYVRLLGVFSIYLPFFLACGLVFGFLLRVVQPEVQIDWLHVAGTVSAAWFIGYVTPGASGGIGVRDALLLLAIDGYVAGSLAALVVVAYRILTVLGDLGFFGLALLFRIPAAAEPVQAN